MLIDMLFAVVMICVKATLVNRHTHRQPAIVRLYC